MAEDVAEQIANLLNSQNQLTLQYTAAKVLADQDHYIVRQDNNSKVLGAVEVNVIQWYQCEIAHLSVDPEAKRQGVGTWLLQEAEAKAKQLGARIAQCTIRVGNKTSEGLFKKHKYSPTITFLNRQNGNEVTVYQKVLEPAPEWSARLAFIVRVVLALASVGIIGWRLVRMNGLLNAVAAVTSVEAIPYNPAVQKGVELLLEQSDSWAQATILLLGVLAGLWVAKGNDPRLALRWSLLPEIAMWCAGAGMLLAGLYCYKEYLAAIVAAFEVGGLTSVEVAGSTSRKVISFPNVFGDKYEALRAEQFLLLLYGFVASGLAVFSVRNLARVDDVKK